MDVRRQIRVQTITSVVIATILVTYSLYWLRPVLVPFALAVFVVSGISPILSSLERRLGVSRVIAAGIAFVAGIGVILLLAFSLWSSAVELKRDAPAYRARVHQLMIELEDRTGFLRRDRLEKSAPDAEAIGDEEAEASQIATTEALASQNDAAIDPLVRFRGLVDSLIEAAVRMVSAEFITLVSTSVVVLIYVFFLLLGHHDLSQADKTIRDIDHQIRSYLMLKTGVSILTGFAFGFALWLFGVPMATTFGVLAFFLNFIPNVGPLVASLLPVPFVVLAPDASLAWMITVIAVTSMIQVVSGNVVEPRLMGKSSDLHPVVVLLALMFWGMMWGITGMFLATPMTAGIKIVLERLESTQPLAAMLAGRMPRNAEEGLPTDQVA